MNLPKGTPLGVYDKNENEWWVGDYIFFGNIIRKVLFGIKSLIYEKDFIIFKHYESYWHIHYEVSTDYEIIRDGKKIEKLFVCKGCGKPFSAWEDEMGIKVTKVCMFCCAPSLNPQAAYEYINNFYIDLMVNNLDFNVEKSISLHKGLIKALTGVEEK